MIRPVLLLCATLLAPLVMFGQNAITCPATTAGHPFDRISIYNGKPGGQEYELAPDDIPINVQTCTFAFEIDRKGAITGGRSFACR